jgi:hypothetical protein
MSAIGMAWYSPQAWKQLAAIPEARVTKSYSAFLRAYEDGVRGFAAQGIAVEKMPVDINHMVEWCHRNGYAADHKGRAVYGTMLMLARDDPNAMNAPVVDKTRSVQ